MLVLGIGVLLNVYVAHDLGNVVSTLSVDARSNLDARFQPEHLASYVTLWVDRGQAPGPVVSCAIGLRLIPRASVIWTFDFVAFVVAVVALVLVFVPKNQWLHGARAGKAGLTLPVLAVLVANVVGLFAAVIVD